jgi:uncharacterized membrane protein
MSSKDKLADEKFCTSCGEVVKKKAEICPNCGVPNNKQSSPSVAKSSSQSAITSSGSNKILTHNPSNYETNVSESWWYGVTAGVVLWVIGFLFPEGSSIGGFFFLIAWVLMPISIYFDRQWVQATTNWQPGKILWLILSAIPLVNIVAGSVYVIRRYNTEQVSTPTAKGRNNNNQSKEDAAIQQLRKRYVNGELTEAEFEQKVEKTVETEQINDVDT